ncbi:hypothetical protein ABZW30_06965 [Kitasatospora sp. NPDC004669]|uniref:hypothetical protein n=1 Tax=Kitasatospora sp. NPDC004669 TaxID=3154555 RepID=UPI0033A53DB3
MTGAHFIGAHTPRPWSGWTLAGAIDAAFVMALQADATLARFGSDGGAWPTAFRWLTGAFSVFVNIGDAALAGDPVGVLVHLIAPVLLLVLGEAGPAWRRQLVSLSRTPPSFPDSCSALPGGHPHTSDLTDSVTDTVGQPEMHTRSQVHTCAPSLLTDTVPPSDAQEARARIVQGRLDGLSQRETARRAHRSPAFVRKVWTAMDKGSDSPGHPRNAQGVRH